VGTGLADPAGGGGQQLVDLRQATLAGPTVLVLGNEGHGLRTNVRRECDHIVSIARPAGAGGWAAGAGGGLRGGGGAGGVAVCEVSEGLRARTVDSLNVSVAGGVLMWHYLGTAGLGCPP
jgi:21S rRNA (GM2251-2'-O)-methyltransferase